VVFHLRSTILPVLLRLTGVHQQVGILCVIFAPLSLYIYSVSECLEVHYTTAKLYRTDNASASLLPQTAALSSAMFMDQAMIMPQFQPNEVDSSISGIARELLEIVSEIMINVSIFPNLTPNTD
jgi:hypothetical protein